MKDYEAYLFDWDGTIGKTLEMWLELYRELFAPFSAQELSDEYIATGLGRLREFGLEVGVPLGEIDGVVVAAKEKSRARSVDVDLYESIVGVLEQLKNSGKQLALITTNWPDAVQMMLTRHGLENLFDVIVTAEDVEAHKPDPEGICFVLDRLKVAKVDAVMLGDSDKDLGAAKNAGIDSILFYPPSHQLFYKLSDLELHHPTKVITGWSELLS